MTAEPVFLRPLDVTDGERINKWHNDPALYDYLGGSFCFVSRPSTEEWLRNKQSALGEVNLAICNSEDASEHVGNIYLRNIDWVSRHGELHILIGNAAHRSKGFGQSAIRQLVRHAGHDLGLRRLYLFVNEDNNAAIRTYEKCGFTIEGTLHKHVFKRGHFINVHLMGLCFEEPIEPGAHDSAPVESVPRDPH